MYTSQNCTKAPARNARVNYAFSLRMLICLRLDRGGDGEGSSMLVRDVLQRFFITIFVLPVSGRFFFNDLLVRNNFWIHRVFFPFAHTSIYNLIKQERPLFYRIPGL